MSNGIYQMPEPPPSKRRTRATQETAGSTQEQTSTSVPYAELHCRTNYSFLEGASHADELAARAVALGLKAIAVTDRNSLAGVVRAHVAAKEAGLKLLVGAEIVPEDGPSVVLLATDRAAYGRLSRLITVGRRRAPKGGCRLKVADFPEHAEGLLCCVPLSEESRYRFERRFVPGMNTDVAATHLQSLRDCFGDRCYGLAELHCGPNDRENLQRWRSICSQFNIPIVAANDVHYHDSRRRPLHDVVTAIRHATSLQSLGHELFPNGERHLKSGAQLLPL